MFKLSMFPNVIHLIRIEVRRNVSLPEVNLTLNSEPLQGGRNLERIGVSSLNSLIVTCLSILSLES